MYLSNIKLNHFRNYSKAQIKLCDKVNIFIGNNAQGKTNILESIYILALTKSHRIGLENNIIQNGYDSCKIKGLLFDDDNIKSLELVVSNLKKKVLIDNKEIKKISTYISNMNIIMFSPNDLDIVKGSPQVRRNLMNINLSQLYPIYLNYLNEYNKILKNRNEYLKQLAINGYSDTKYLNILDEKLIDRGSNIILYRKKYLDYINKNIKNYYKSIINIKNIDVNYEPSISITNYDLESIKKEFGKKLKNSLNKDIINRVTLYGPHRDDFSFYIDNNNIKFYGSEGQQRLAIITYKLCEVNLFKEEKNKMPILLLDDIFSELDIKTRNKLIEFIPNDIQVIITTTDLKNIKKSLLNKGKIFIVDKGIVTEKDG